MDDPEGEKPVPESVRKETVPGGMVSFFEGKVEECLGFRKFSKWLNVGLKV